MKSVWVLALLLLLPTILFAESLDMAYLPNGAQYLADQFLVTTKTGVPPLMVQQTMAGTAVTGVSSIDNLCSTYNVVSIEPFYAAPVRLPALQEAISRIYIFHVAKGSDVLSAVNAFSTSRDIECSDPYIIPELFYTPNDPSRTSQWHLTKTQAYAAWDILRGDTTAYAIVGISDTGVYWRHPDLHHNIWINELEDLNGNDSLDAGDINGIDEDGNGYIDDVVGWDLARNDNDPSEDRPIHGTHVAGCVSEVTDNALNGAGVGFSTRILAAKGGRNDTLTAVYQAMTYAADNGAMIINCSWGSAQFSQTYQNLINGFWNSGIVIIAAAGNDGVSSRFYPAAYTNVVSVAATNNSDHKSSFSNYGTWIDISAPGENINSTWSQSGMGYESGTSMASPITAGAMALLRTQNPDWSNADLVSTLLSAADNIDALNPGYAGMLGSGRVNAFTALAAGTVPNISITSYNLVILGNPDSLLNPGDSFNLFMTLHNLWANADSVRITLRVAGFTLTDSSYLIGPIGHNQYGDNNSNPLHGSPNIDIVPGLKTAIVHITANNNYVRDDTIQMDVSMSLPHFPKTFAGEVESAPIIFDVDHNGTNEIVVGASDNYVHVLEADGANLAGWPQAVSNNVITGPAIGDIDHDGANEIVAITKDGRFYAWHTNGTLLTGFPVNKSGTFYSGPTLADLDGDGHLEIIAGSFSDSSVYAIDFNGADHTGWPKRGINRWYYGSPAVGDLDHDGLQEIIYAGFDSSVDAWNGDGTPVSGFPVHLNGPVWGSLAVGDVDQDGNDEIAATTYAASAGSCYLIRNSGAMVSGFPVNIGASIRSGPSLADLDGNNSLEIIFGTNDGHLVALSNSGSPVTGFPKTISGFVYGTPVVGDISGDGLPDIVFGTTTGFLYAVDHSGVDLRNFPIPGDNNHQITTSLALGDLDLNGTMEIIVPLKNTVDPNLLALNYGAQVSLNNLQWPCGGRDIYRNNNFAVNVDLINDPGNLPAQFNLSQNYPNPFNASTSIAFSLEKAGDVKLSIFDIMGREVKVLQTGTLPAGSHSLIWNGTDQAGSVVTSGVYFYRLVTSQGNLTKRMILLK